MEPFLEDMKQFDNCFCKQPDNQPDYRVISVKCGMKGDVIASVFEVRGSSVLLTQILQYDEDYFERIAMWLKDLYFSLDARVIVLDTIGLGMGLADFMVRCQDKDHPSFGMIKDGLEPEWTRWYTKEGLVKDAVYTISPTLSFRETLHIITRDMVSRGKIGIIKSEETLGLREEIDNLMIEEEDGTLLALKVDRRKGRTRFDTVEQGLWWIKNFGYRDGGGAG